MERNKVRGPSPLSKKREYKENSRSQLGRGIEGNSKGEADRGKVLKIHSLDKKHGGKERLRVFWKKRILFFSHCG